MKNKFSALLIFLLLISGGLLTSCKKEKVPTLTTSATTNILGTSATSGGSIVSEGTATVLSRGVCWSTGATPTLTDNKTTDGAGAGSFASSITGLNGATLYYVRAYATNSVGTGYGMTMSFTTFGQSPTPVVAAATNITTTSSTVNGTVNPNYLSTNVTFEYGTNTSYGLTATATQSPVAGNTSASVSADLIGLTAGTIYHLRVKAVNSLGTSFSNDITFTTLGQAPLASSLAASNVSNSSATLNGTVNANYLSSIVTFEYGTTTGYGSTVTATQSPVTGNTSTGVSANITGLSAGTIYHFRAKAVNSLGTSVGSDIQFVTPLADIDGNIYHAIAIGTQIWMVENLKVTKYNDGTSIPLITNNTDWLNLSGPGYCWYNNDAVTYKSPYGAMYNWFAVNTGKLCPTGWHVSTDAEWTTLTDGLGGLSVAGGKLKETGTSHWTSPNTGATNETGFTTIPGGYRAYQNGTFLYIYDDCTFWTATSNTSLAAWGRAIVYNSGAVQVISNDKKYGASVRCIKD